MPSVPLHCSAMQEDGKFDRKPTELRQLSESQCCPTHKPLNLIWVNYLEISNSQHGRPTRSKAEKKRRRRKMSHKDANRVIASLSGPRHTLLAKHKKSISNVRGFCRALGSVYAPGLLSALPKTSFAKLDFSSPTANRHDKRFGDI